jgi:myosin heavy subunit
MTVLGKILVFVNLVFSLLTAGLIVMVYTTRVNWNEAYKKQTAAVAVARGDAQAAEADKKAAVDKADAQYQTLKAERDKVASEVRGLNDQLVKQKADYEAAMKTQTSSQQVVQDQTAELARRKAEVENQKKLVDDRDKKIADIDRQMARLRDESVQYKIQWEQSKERNALLQSQVEQLARDNERMRQQLGGSSARGIAPAPAPSSTGSSSYPPARIEDLQGTIQRVDGDLATITPGSDAGVAVGAKLRVFHFQPKPEYLGVLTIQAVTSTQAVGQLTGPKAKQVKAGDLVDSK